MLCKCTLYIILPIVYILVLRVRVKMIYFDKENHDIEETNTETFMCRSMSATNAYTEL